MITIRRVLVTFVAALACSVFTAQAAEAVFTASMDGAQGVPEPIKTNATGTVELRLSADGRKMSYKVTIDKLSNVAAADLHLGPVGQNGPLVVKLFPHGNSPKKGLFSGLLTEGSFDASDFVGSMNGAPMADLVEQLRAGNVYVNVHTNDGMDPPNSGPGDYRLGEIRGQLK
jgi:hypothetical protein